jgi:hypothetical protein
MYSPYPYRKLASIIEFEPGDVLQHLAISPSGQYLAATLHQANGCQSVIVADLSLLKKDGRFLYRTMSNEGSPEFPSWSPDESHLYWSACTNGVYNIYRCHRETLKIEAMSHTLLGLSRPLYLSADSLFAFEFGSEGFFGQKVVEHNPEVTEWVVQTEAGPDDNGVDNATAASYRGLTQVRMQSLIPVVSGFQDRKVIGLYAHLSDPLNTHDFTFEAGLSPASRKTTAPRFHFRGQYEYGRKYSFNFEHNAPSFYDLFNQRRSGMIGTKAALGYTHYRKFDNPHKIKQSSTLSLYKGVKAINDNLISVANPDFLVLETSVSSENVRRAIGSVDSEFGNKWSVAVTALGMNPRAPQEVGAGFHAAWSRFQTWAVPHNVLHVQLAGGYFQAQENFSLDFSLPRHADLRPGNATIRQVDGRKQSAAVAFQSCRLRSAWPQTPRGFGVYAGTVD